MVRCSNKSLLTIFININGESHKIQIGTKNDIPDPKLHEMVSKSFFIFICFFVVFYCYVVP